jgi:ribosome-associated translation inhibitor RaiA
MKTLNTQEMIQGAIDEIRRYAPHNAQIDIEVREDPVGNFATHILVQANHHTYFSKKEDMFLYRSFNKAMRAVKAQLAKKRVTHETAQPRFDNYHPAA